MKEMMVAITGLCFRPAEIEYLLNKNQLKKIGKKLETKFIFIDKFKGYDRKKQKVLVKDAVNNLEEAIGWELFDDGCNSQQPIDKHKVTMRRWV